MANYYNSSHDLQRLSIGVPIQGVIKIKPNSGYFREDIKIHGERVGLLDVNNRIREEYECSDVYDGGQPLHKLFDEVCPPYIRAVLEGVNIAVVAFGTTGAGKSFSIEGDGAEPGMVNFFTSALFETLDDKKYRLNAGLAPNMSNQGFSYSVKMRYLEICDEECTDLLIQANSNAQGNLYVVQDEWEGPSISNTTWLPAASASHLIDMFTLAKRNRTQTSNEFGLLHEKSAAILTIEVLQVAQNSSTDETSVLASRLYFIDMPGAEKLHEDPESLRIREGNTLNKGIMQTAELIRNLANSDGAHVNYDASMLTSLLKDIVGGNCLTMALICLQNGDMTGSSMVLNYMRLLRSINNFPVVNDSRQLGLLRKYRIELIHYMNTISMLGPGGLDRFNNQITDLEKELIEGNLDKLRYVDERTQMQQRLREMKEAYNKVIKEKADLQEELIKSEEDRLQVTKALIELQIENAQLQEKVADEGYNINNRLLYAENEVLAANMKEEKALQAINEMQERMKKVLEEKREIEIEFVALKSNYMNLSNELNDEKLKNENLSIELINLVNANKALTGDTDYLAKLKGQLSEDQERVKLENSRFKKQLQEAEEALLNARTEIEQLRSELIKYDLNAQRQQVDYDNRKVELEREYLDVVKKNDLQAKDRVGMAEQQVRQADERMQLGQSDMVVLNRQLKIAQRKIQELEDNLNEYQKHDHEMTEEVHRLQLQLEEMRANFRSKLIRAMNEGVSPGQEALRGAREELVRSYNEREVDLTEKLNKEYASNAHQLKIIRGLRAYTRSLRNLAEDWAPVGTALPDLLTMPPPILLEDEDQTLNQKAQTQELERLRLRNHHLEQEVKTLQQQLISNTENYTQMMQGRNPQLQQKLANELEYLRGAPVGAQRPGSGSYDADVLRKERNQLREEVRKLNGEIRDLRARGVGGGGDAALQEENRRLQARLEQAEKGRPDVGRGAPPGAGGGDTRLAQQKISYLEDMLRKLEKERSELSVRATMAEEQLKNLHEHMNSSIQNYQRKIAELKRIVTAIQIQQLKGGRPMPEIDSKIGDSLRFQ